MASVGAGVAATEERGGGSPPGTPNVATPAGAFLAAALALPGILPALWAPLARAEMTPDAGQIALKYLDYRDWQPGADRMRVKSPSLYVLKPIGDALAVEGTLVYDGISGASPRYHDALSGASGIGITEYRTAGDVKFTYYAGRVAFGVGAAVSSERDYLGRAASLDLRLSTPDNNRTWSFGIAGNGDRINSVNGVAEDQMRHAVELLLGVTQVLSADAIVQSNLTYSDGHGYYSDPYKLLDTRPDHRRVFAWLIRAHRYLPAVDATLQVSYRLLTDSFGGTSNALEAAWVQVLPAGWSVTPNLRYSTQSAADFYYNPPFPSGYVPGQYYTADTRLSAFGALTGGVWVIKRFADGWSADLNFQFYRQESDWRVGGSGSPGLEPFSARSLQVGVAKTF
jgi:Protein of unknown function (DUF3570)